MNKKIKKVASKTLKFGVIAAGGFIAICAIYIYYNKPGEGKGNWRSTHRKDGRPKQAFDTAERANFQTIKQAVLHGEFCPAYQIDGKYYTGHRHAA